MISKAIPKVTICGRADPKSIALATKLILRSIETEVELTRSDLVFYVFEFIAHVATDSAKLTPFAFAEDAFDYLESLGITWEGEKFKREKTRALQADAFEGLTSDQASELRDIIVSFKEHVAKRRIAGAIEDPVDEVSESEILTASRIAKRKAKKEDKG